jgi:hypothetical protein
MTLPGTIRFSPRPTARLQAGGRGGSRRLVRGGRGSPPGIVLVEVGRLELHFACLTCTRSGGCRPSNLRFRRTFGDRSCPPLSTVCRSAADPARTKAARLVADACGARVLRDQGPDGPAGNGKVDLPATYGVGGVPELPWANHPANLATHSLQMKISVMTAKVSGSLTGYSAP